MWNRFTDDARQTILKAQEIAGKQHHSVVDSGHLCLALLDDGERNQNVFQLLQICGVSLAEARLYAQSTLESLPPDGGEPKLTPGAKKLLELAADEARQIGSENIGVEHLFIACVRHQSHAHVGEVLRPLGLDAGALRQHLLGLSGSKRGRGSSPLNLLNNDSKKALDAAEARMRATFCGQISTTHLLLGLLDEGHQSALNPLMGAGVDIEAFKQEVRGAIVTDGHVAMPQRRFSAATKRALERAKREAYERDFSLIGPNHLLLGLLPAPISLPERISFGGAVSDPLDKVWPHWPTDEIRKQYEAIRLRERRFVGKETLSWTERSNKAIHAAYQEAVDASHSRISTGHLLCGILNDRDSLATELLAKAGCDIEQLKKHARELQPEKLSMPNMEKYSPAVRQALLEANLAALTQGFKFVDTSHLLMGLFLRDEAEDSGDSVKQLLSPLQLEALHRELQKVSLTGQVVAPPADTSQHQLKKRGLKLGLFGAVVGFSSGLFSNFTDTSGGDAVAKFVLLYFLGGSAVATVLAYAFNRSARAKVSWSSLFCGLVIGLLLCLILVPRD